MEEEKIVMQLRELETNKNNIDHIVSLYIACFNAPEKGENWTYETAHQYFLDRKAEGSIFATHEGGQEINTICCASDYSLSFIADELNMDLDNTAYISLIAISEKYRGKSLGTNIVNAFCILLAEKGFEKALIRCRSENGPMLSILSKLDFKLLQEYNADLGGVACQRSVFLKELPRLEKSSH